MPKDKVSDPITEQEIAFARLVLSGAMTDRQAAEAVGLDPDSAAYTKAKPRVHAYMLGHRAALQQQLVQQKLSVEGQHRPNLDREHVLDRLWEIANLSPETTRGSVTGQVKAISIIVAMENFIPNRLAISSEKKSPPSPTPEVYSAWLRQQKASASSHHERPAANPSPCPTRRCARCRLDGRGGPGTAPPSPTFTNPLIRPEAPSAPNVPRFDFRSRPGSGFLYEKEHPCTPAPVKLTIGKKHPKLSNFKNNCQSRLPPRQSS